MKQPRSRKTRLANACQTPTDMAEYEAVSEHETVVEDTVLDLPEHSREASQTMRNLQIYVQVPLQSSKEPRPDTQVVHKPCMHTFIFIGLALFFAAFALTVRLLFHFSKFQDG